PIWHSTCLISDMCWRLALAAFSIAACLFAQENPVTTFRTESNLVSLNVSAFDQEGRIVKGLPQSAFTVFEDNQKQEIKIFRQEDVPISLGLVIDASASMFNKRERVNLAALAMVKASNPDDEVFVISFSDEAVVTQDFTSDAKRLESSLRKFDSNK